MTPRNSSAETVLSGILAIGLFLAVLCIVLVLSFSSWPKAGGPTKAVAPTTMVSRTTSPFTASNTLSDTVTTTTTTTLPPTTTTTYSANKSGWKTWHVTYVSASSAMSLHYTQAKAALGQGKPGLSIKELSALKTDALRLATRANSPSVAVNESMALTASAAASVSSTGVLAVRGGNVAAFTRAVRLLKTDYTLMGSVVKLAAKRY